MPEATTPLTVDGLACPTEPEGGRELHFCPVRGLPIERSQRVRALPGFHLLSLDAGKEALARGSYQAFGQQFPCQNLEYLHVDDKVFICAEDHKAFLNQMSMQYHRYIRHELEERKAERKRLRARAQERKVRSEVHAAQAHQRQQQAQNQPQQLQQPPQSQQPQKQQSQLESPAQLEGVASSTRATIDAVISSVASNEAEADDDAMEDPYAVPVIAADPYSEAGATSARAATSPAVDAVSGSASQTAAVKRVAGALARAADKLPAQTTTEPLGAGPESAAEELADLYGDIGDDQAKRQKTASDYASAIGAMMDDFDEDE